MIMHQISALYGLLLNTFIGESQYNLRYNESKAMIVSVLKSDESALIYVLFSVFKIPLEDFGRIPTLFYSFGLRPKRIDQCGVGLSAVALF